MAKPITVTPEIRGKDAEVIRHEIIHGSKTTPDRVETLRRAEEAFRAIQDRSPFAIRP